MALLARDVLTRHPGARILLDAKTSLSVIRDVRAHGGEPVLTPTGYSLLRRRMEAEKILFGGEASGHIVFAEDYYGIDDGVYAACAAAKILAAEGRPLSAHLAGMQRLVTSPEIMLPCADQAKFRVAAAITERLRAAAVAVDADGTRIDFGDGWALVRASNTNPVLSIRMEGGRSRPLRGDPIARLPCGGRASRGDAAAGLRRTGALGRIESQRVGRHGLRSNRAITDANATDHFEPFDVPYLRHPRHGGRRSDTGGGGAHRPRLRHLPRSPIRCA